MCSRVQHLDNLFVDPSDHAQHLALFLMLENFVENVEKVLVDNRILRNRAGIPYYRGLIFLSDFLSGLPGIITWSNWFSFEDSGENWKIYVENPVENVDKYGLSLKMDAFHIFHRVLHQPEFFCPFSFSYQLCRRNNNGYNPLHPRFFMLKKKKGSCFVSTRYGIIR